MAFMSHYGAGAIDDSFSILVPNTLDRSVGGGMAGGTRNAAGLWDEGSGPVLRGLMHERCQAELSRFREFLGEPQVNGDISHDWRALEAGLAEQLPQDHKDS
ncbi:hypothetical protein [Streptomyces sp. ATCC 21386]|uniref:hypothetical protein n=1 Tax=Streptomyces sp. ATCC 21386 TaxID=2699428 RepID=UPI001BFF8427|nr:hypothetical protein [Streptomyces sp. ATCC 21386]